MQAVMQFFNRMGLNDTQKLQMLAGPILIIMILAMMILPLPPFVLDLLFTFNIALSIMVLMVSMFTLKPLDFAAFPAVLLFSTLLRLSLNVASTRVVLMEGHQGGDAAGKVIEAFGQFLVGGNFAVGLVVFIILVVINFIVITKGAGRIAEVGARFTLDAMPGRQMAIDADLNAGLIDEAEAKSRRQEVTQEAEFYGSMDGASKFVRGDAIAGILIMVINIIGGLAIGAGQHGMELGQAATTYTLLTIGDGLVAQIPALVISTSAGVTVSRVNTNEDVGQQMISQLLMNPKVMLLAAGVMGLLGLVPGMPNLVFLLFTGALLGFAYLLSKREKAIATAEETPPEPTDTPHVPEEASWDDVNLIDTLSIDVGHRLIPLVDPRQNGALLGRIKGVRKKYAQEMGFLPPVVHIRDDLEIEANLYILKLKGVECGRGECFPGQFLAINPGHAVGELEGTPTKDPAFGLDAYWISETQRDMAQINGYTVVDSDTVIATHLNHILHQHAADLLGRTEVEQLLEKLKQNSANLVEDVVPKVLSVAGFQRVLQYLLEEKVNIRDMQTIMDCLAEVTSQTTDPRELVAFARVALGRGICQQWYPGNEEMAVMALETELEQVLAQAMNSGGAIEPGLADTLLQQTQMAVQSQEAHGEAPVLVVQHTLRPMLARFLIRTLPQMAVLSQNEIPDDRRIRVSTIIGGQPMPGGNN